MSSGEISVFVPVIAALTGASAAGLAGWVGWIRSNRTEAAALEAALVAEIKSICDMVRLRELLLTAQATREATASETEIGPEGELPFYQMQVHNHSNYCTIYESLAGKIGKLDPAFVRKVVMFYGHYRMAFDALDPKGIPYKSGQREQGIKNTQLIIDSLNHLLRIGDELVQCVKK